jgi:hypothetical protein
MEVANMESVVFSYIRLKMLMIETELAAIALLN